jgi:hypothetical protein
MIYAFKVTQQFVVIYDLNMFIVQVTGAYIIKLFTAVINYVT